MKKLKILITNDDGYEAKGLRCLIEALEDIADLTIVAPATEKSACGHSLTLTRPLRFVNVADNFHKLDDGTPSDKLLFEQTGLFFIENWPTGSGTQRHRNSFHHRV